jgi:hypothetical protein
MACSTQANQRQIAGRATTTDPLAGTHASMVPATNENAAKQTWVRGTESVMQDQQGKDEQQQDTYDTI